MKLNRWLTIPCVVIQLLVLNAYPQSAVYWPTDDSSWYSPEDPRAIDNVKMRYKPYFNPYNPAGIFQALAVEFDSSGIDWSSNPAIKNNFRMELDSLIAESTSGKNPETDDDVGKIIAGIKTVRFMKTGNTITLFEGKSTQIELIPCDGDVDTCLTEEQAIDIRLRAKTIDRILNEFKDSLRMKFAEGVKFSRLAWNNYLFGSPFLFPWEMFINGLSAKNSSLWVPPAGKWLILHPGMGLRLRDWKTGNLDSMTLDQVLLIEIGRIWYLNSLRSSSIGISALAALGGQSPVGFGGALHYNGILLGACVPATGIEHAEKISFIGTIDLIGLAHWAREKTDDLFSGKTGQITEKADSMLKTEN